MIDRMFNLDLPPLALYAFLLAIAWGITWFLRSASRGALSTRVGALCSAIATWFWLPFDILAWGVSIIVGIPAFLVMRRVPDWFMKPSQPVLWFFGAVYGFDIIFQYVADTGFNVGSGFLLVLGGCAVGGTLGELYSSYPE